MLVQVFSEAAQGIELWNCLFRELNSEPLLHGKHELHVLERIPSGLVGSCRVRANGMPEKSAEDFLEALFSLV